MLPASWTFDTNEKRHRSLNAENLRSIGQRASKMLAVKLWKWFDCAWNRTQCAIAHNMDGMAEVADLFLRTPTLKACNFAALCLTDP